MNSGKRRSENFSEAEKALLLKLVPVHLSVIEATENDVFTNRNKKLTWESITKQYNESVKEIDGPTREPHHLRGLYRRLKLVAKREYLSFKEKNSNATLEESLSKWSRLLYELVPASVESLHKERQMGHSEDITHGGSRIPKLTIGNGLSAALSATASTIQTDGLTLTESLETIREFSSVMSLTDSENLRKRRLKSELSECSDSENEKIPPIKQPQQSRSSPITDVNVNQTLHLNPMSIFEMLQIQLMTEILNEVRDIKTIIARGRIKSPTGADD